MSRDRLHPRRLPGLHRLRARPSRRMPRNGLLPDDGHPSAMPLLWQQGGRVVAWLRVDDTSPTHPRVMRLGSLKDDRQLNEAWGFVVRCAAYSAQHTTDGFVSELTAMQFGAGRAEALVKIARKADLFGPKMRSPAGEPGWQIALDVDELLHIRFKDEIDWERRHRAQLRDPDIFLPVRLRDGDGCRYCDRIVNWRDGRSARAGTLDHVMPDGDVLVVACKGCNSKKLNRTPDEAGLVLKPAPTEPHYSAHTLALFERYGVTPATLAASEDTAQRATAPGGTAAPARPATPADPARTAPTQHGPSPDVPRRGRPDLLPPGRDGSGQVGSGDVRSRARDGPTRTRKRGRRGRRGQAA